MQLMQHAERRALQNCLPVTDWNQKIPNNPGARIQLTINKGNEQNCASLLWALVPRRLMTPDMPDFSAQEFVEKMDLGLFDGKLHQEIDKLSHEHLREVDHILTQRPKRGTSPSGTQI
jgi:hypothetical protein